MLLCWPVLITHNFPGYGTVPSDWQVLWHQSLHKLSFWHDVLGCSCCNLLHKAGQNIIISSVVLVHNFWYYCSLMCCCNTCQFKNGKSALYNEVIPWIYGWFFETCSMKWMAESQILCLWILHWCWSISLNSFGGNLDIGVPWTLLTTEVYSSIVGLSAIVFSLNDIWLFYQLAIFLSKVLHACLICFTLIIFLLKN